MASHSDTSSSNNLCFSWNPRTQELSPTHLTHIRAFAGSPNKQTSKLTGYRVDNGQCRDAVLDEESQRLDDGGVFGDGADAVVRSDAQLVQRAIHEGRFWELVYLNIGTRMRWKNAEQQLTSLQPGLWSTRLLLSMTTSFCIQPSFF